MIARIGPSFETSSTAAAVIAAGTSTITLPWSVTSTFAS